MDAVMKSVSRINNKNLDSRLDNYLPGNNFTIPTEMRPKASRFKYKLST